MSIIVETNSGKLKGISHDDFKEFRGVPYAKPPVGEQRFKAPQPLEPWDDIRNANRFSDASIQEEISMFGIGNTSEDCLYLNIWTPACDDKQRPVMLWIHGGGYATGSGAQLIYRGRDLARNGDVVVVTINYRLGALGFLHLEGLIDDDYGVSNNNGLRDQMAALAWVKENIHYFGGNRDEITIMGESAGAMSVATLLACPSAKNFYKRAILQSGSGDHVLTKGDAEKISRTFLQAAEIDPDHPDKLWQLNEKQLLAAQRACARIVIDRGVHRQTVTQIGMAFMPLVDGDLLPRTPLTAIDDGDAADIPLLVGYTRDEWNLFLHTPGPDGSTLAQKKYQDLDKLGLIDLCERGLPGLGEKTANLYEKVVRDRTTDAEADYVDMYSAFETDRMFRIPSLNIAAAQSKHSEQVYAFSFQWDKGIFGACHAVDIPFVFGSVESGLGQILTGGGDLARKLSDRVQACWIAFARSGNPGTDEVGAWPGYDTESRQVMIFDEEIRVESDPASKTRKHWEGIL